MKYPPLTREDAERTVYGSSVWTRHDAHPSGRYSHRHCAYRVQRRGGSGTGQCARRPGHGPAALYCPQHARIVATTTQ